MEFVFLTSVNFDPYPLEVWMVMMVAVSSASFAPLSAGIILLYPQSRPKGSCEVPKNSAESSAQARQYGGDDDACFLASCFLDVSWKSQTCYLTGYKLCTRTFNICLLLPSHTRIDLSTFLACRCRWRFHRFEGIFFPREFATALEIHTVRLKKCWKDFISCIYCTYVNGIVKGILWLVLVRFSEIPFRVGWCQSLRAGIILYSNFEGFSFGSQLCMNQKQQQRHPFCLRECRSYENSVGRMILTASLIDFLTISCASGWSKRLGKLRVAFICFYVLCTVCRLLHHASSINTINEQQSFRGVSCISHDVKPM